MGDFKIKSNRDEIKSDLYQFIKEQNYFQKKLKCCLERCTLKTWIGISEKTGIVLDQFSPLEEN